MGSSRDGNDIDAVENPFSVGTDPALSVQVRRELLDTLHARTNYDKATANQELDERDVHEDFRLHFGELGLATDNLPDLLAGHLLVMWCIVHGAVLPSPEIAKGVSRQFAAQIATNPMITDPARRQLMGEALLYEAVLSLEAYRLARDAGDKAKLRQMAESAQTALLSQRGTNLRKTRLTASGMMRA